MTISMIDSLSGASRVCACFLCLCMHAYAAVFALHSLNVKEAVMNGFHGVRDVSGHRKRVSSDQDCQGIGYYFSCKRRRRRNLNQFVANKSS